MSNYVLVVRNREFVNDYLEKKGFQVADFYVSKEDRAGWVWVCVRGDEIFYKGSDLSVLTSEELNAHRKAGLIW